MCRPAVVRMEMWVKSLGRGQSYCSGMSLSFSWEPSSWDGFFRAQSTSPFQQSSQWWPRVSKVGLELGVTACQLASGSAAGWEFIPTCLGMLPLFAPQEGRGAPRGW